MHDITLEVIHVVTGFCNVGEVLALRKINKMKMTKLTSLVSDSRGITTNSINVDLVKYVCMVIGYQMIHASRINSISTVVVNVTYKMIKEDASFDLCTYMKRQLLVNLKSLK